MIEFKDVAFQYEQGSSKGKIENINLTIHDGEVVLICGESGCGKTTLTRLINGLIPHYYEGTLTGQTIVEELIPLFSVYSSWMRTHSLSFVPQLLM